MWRKRYYRPSKPTPRNIEVKYAGNCACCGAEIKAGQVATYYPIGTIAGVHKGSIAHIGGLDGNSKVCFNHLKAKAVAESSPDRFDMQYEDDCRDRCGLGGEL